MATQEATPHARPRIPRSYEHARWAQSAQEPPPQRPQTTDCLGAIQQYRDIAVLAIAYRIRPFYDAAARGQGANAIGDSLSLPSHPSDYVITAQPMLSKQYRLRKNNQIQELRRVGRSWHNQQLVLITSLARKQLVTSSTPMLNSMHLELLMIQKTALFHWATLLSSKLG